MTDRRRNQRFLLRAPLEGRLRLTREVLVERYDPEELVVLSPVPAAQNDVLQMNDVLLRPPLAVNVKVRESAPVMVNGTMQHRLSLRASSNGIHAAQIVGSLAKEVAVRLRDVCRNGCLLEGDTFLEPGNVGELMLVIGGHLSSGIVRVTRCQMVAGRAPACYIGAEFVGRGMRGMSLPLAVDRLAGEEEWAAAAADSPVGKG